MNSRKKLRELGLKTLVFTVGSIGFFILLSIIYYITSTGAHLISWDMITGDHRTVNVDITVNPSQTNLTVDNLDDEIYYSSKWGVGFYDATNREGNPIVKIGYVHPNSPFKEGININVRDENSEEYFFTLKEGYSIEKAFFEDPEGFVIARMGAEAMANAFQSSNIIQSATFQNVGGGIRGSIITTVYMIFLTLIMVLPIGIMSAIYLNEFAKKTKSTRIIRQMVDLLTGVPSIIYGMLGAALFIRFLNALHVTSGGSVLSGAMTMAVVLLPTIIKNTEEALKIVPVDIRTGSLALGANQTQTIFKVVIPNAIPGILTGVLLGIGRIMGESAALIFAVGATIKDTVILTERSTTLATHIWVIMGGEKPNFELAAAISILILTIVFIINFAIKLIVRSFYNPQT
ncbi:MAG: phosphate ABC transporter permease PstA [Candidatus Izemoplasmataceae bacterium]